MGLKQLSEGKERDTEENGYFEGHRRSSSTVAEAEMIETQGYLLGIKACERKEEDARLGRGKSELSCRPFKLRSKLVGS